MYSTAWGKTDGHGGFHALAAHSMDVAAVFLALCRVPVIAARLDAAAERKATAEDLVHLAALVFLHDVGKLLPGFQAKGRPDLSCRADVKHAEAGWRVLAAGSAAGHPLASILRRIEGWGPAVEPMLTVIFAHHGKPVPCNLQPYPAVAVPGYDMMAAMVDFRRMWE